MSYHSLRTPREAITEIVRHAPPEVRPAIIALIRAAYRSLKRGYQPDVRAVPLRSWRSLLQLLSSGVHDFEITIQVGMFGHFYSIEDNMCQA